MPKLILRLCLLVAVLVPATLLLARAERRESPPIHRHVWREFRPQDGSICLVDDRNKALRRLRPGQVARVKVIGLPGTDQCVAPGCPFGAEGLASECVGPRVVGFSDHDAGGTFGRLDATGRFTPAPASEVAGVTHYRAPSRACEVRLAARFDDTGRTVAAGGEWIATFNDPPHECRPWRVVVAHPSPSRPSRRAD
jgi:hypothetical protein